MDTLKEFDSILREATQQVEDALSLEDKGWVNLSTQSVIIPDADRITTVKEARLYFLKDPLAHRAVSLMTDYSFGTGISWNCKDDPASKIISAFWSSPDNKVIFSSKGQRKSSDKLLIDGEIFFAVFLGNETTVRRVNPLEITEVITDPDDIENVRFYKREWTDTKGSSHLSYYRSFANLENKACPDSLGKSIQKTEDALVYHLAINDLTQRGNSFLLPALEWIKLYRKFLASRVAVMLALARFAWKVKVQGGQTAVNATKAVYHEEEIKAGSTSIENMGADLQPIRTDSGASQAYQDGRQIKLQVSAGTGWPEQYFGDISIGNLATAKTVELPVQKMCESYQAIWTGAYTDLFQLILNENKITKAYIDLDFPKVSEEAAASVAQSIMQMVQTFPEFANSTDVQQQALLTLGIKDVNEALEQISKEAKRDPNVKLAKALRDFKESLKGTSDGHGRRTTE
ncbi:MAG: hypothetical protein MUO61_03345 [Dehalococcoidia bacterium]|nr:hypothetical protein [Dehalococcoidia bacterium]